jgi:hypothetical protein
MASTPDESESRGVCCVQERGEGVPFEGDRCLSSFDRAEANKKKWKKFTFESDDRKKNRPPSLPKLKKPWPPPRSRSASRASISLLGPVLNPISHSIPLSPRKSTLNSPQNRRRCRRRRRKRRRRRNLRSPLPDLPPAPLAPLLPRLLLWSRGSLLPRRAAPPCAHRP